MDDLKQRLWAEIDLDNIVYNYQQARAASEGREAICVLKANAYGHGAVATARALIAAGATRFAVSTAEEALHLRRHGIGQSILLLGMVDGAAIKTLSKQNIELCVGNIQTARAYSAAAERPLKIHLKLETGMGRTGLPYHSATADILAIAALPNLRLEAIFTHFAAADDPAENEFTHTQMDRFKWVDRELRQRDLNIPLRHCANSAGILAHPYSHADLIRPGIMLYGVSPIFGHPLALKPTMAIRTRIMQIQGVPRGVSVGYGRTWFAPRDSVIATVGVGYADGLQRILSGRMPFLVKGREAPLVGRICMDMSMIDITDIPGVAVGDIATIMGADGEAAISAEQLAQNAQTIPHEIFCALGLRVPRYYYQKGKLCGEDNYLEKI